MKIKSIVNIFPICLILMTAGCSTARLSMSEQSDWQALVNQKVVSRPIPFKSSKAAVIWDIIVPGVGSTYAGGGACWGWIVGGIAAWPVSPFYQPFIGRKIARNESERRTIEYYKFGSHIEKLEKLKANGKLPADFKSKEEARVTF